MNRRLLLIGEGQSTRPSFVGATHEETTGSSMLCDRHACPRVIQRRLRKSENTIDSGDLPFSNHAILSFPGKLPMHARGMGTVDHLCILLAGAIGQVKQTPCLIEESGRQFSVSLWLDQIPNIRGGRHPLGNFSFSEFCLQFPNHFCYFRSVFVDLTAAQFEVFF
jgi:hypothetical protein